ncbi:MAG: J domain-containing protein [Halobacteriales archaeon]
MLHDPAGALPPWLLYGLVIGGTLAVLVASAFALGTRLFPESTASTGASRGGEDRRRGEIREYLLAIEEPFVEDREVAGEPVAFYLPDRDVAITFDAHHYFAVDRTDTHAILVEYEMPGHGIGRRLPFETPDVEAAMASPDDEDGAFAVLGLDRSATTEEVQAAYRDRIKDVHPDHGGDRESFERVREAYTVARERAR